MEGQMGDGRPPSAREMGERSEGGDGSNASLSLAPVSPLPSPLSSLLSLILTSRLTGMTTGLHSSTEAS